MANPTPQQVKQAVDDCNKAIHSIDNNIGELDIIEELRGYSSQLEAVWQTENGENSIAGFNRTLNSLKTYTDNLKSSMEKIKNDTYTFTEVEYYKGSGRL